MTEARLPSFEHPPVIETVLGVQFDPLPKLTNAHLGAFWSILGPDWRNVTQVPPLEPSFEQFGKGGGWGPFNLKFRLSQDPACRLQIRRADNEAMIQVQNGRFHYNWLGETGADYRRYDRVKPEFDRWLKAFITYLGEEDLGEIVPNQWEVTYVNHFPKDSVWSTPEDWVGLFPGLPRSHSATTAAQLESFRGEWHFEIEPKRGRLHVEIHHGRTRSKDGAELLVMQLTARGQIPEETPQTSDGDVLVRLGPGLDLGHETIVTAFRDLTPPHAHKYWGSRK